MQRAENAYRAGRHLEAVEKLTQHEGEVAAMSAHRQARYGMVRGMALLEMGDHEEARHWLRYTYDLEDREPTLRAAERAELDAAWQKLSSSQR